MNSLTSNPAAYYTNARAKLVPPMVKIEGDRLVPQQDVVVHKFRLGDVDDPDIYAAQAIISWQESDSGRWIMQNAVNQPFWIRNTNQRDFYIEYHIVARLREPDEVFWRLKFKS